MAHTTVICWYCVFSQQIIAENLAKAYAFYKNWNEAGEICKKLVSLNTSDLQAVEMYARTLAMSGKIPESKAQYERALELAQQQNDEAIVTRVCTASFSRDLCQFLRLVIVLFVKEICRQKARLHYGGFWVRHAADKSGTCAKKKSSARINF